jgi:phage baseplate assembly protein W
MSEAPFLGRGWAFPPSFAPGGAEIEMVSGPTDVHQSLQIILGTAPGERVMQEAFGCDLSSLVFEEVDQGLLRTIERLVSDAILEYEPRVEVERLEVTQSATEASCVLISIHYSIRGTNSRFNMVFPFYLMEAAQPGP